MPLLTDLFAPRLISFVLAGALSLSTAHAQRFTPPNPVAHPFGAAGGGAPMPLAAAPTRTQTVAPAAPAQAASLPVVQDRKSVV